jgi:hypothetical protein
MAIAEEFMRLLERKVEKTHRVSKPIAGKALGTKDGVRVGNREWRIFHSLNLAPRGREVFELRKQADWTRVRFKQPG